MIWLLAAYLLYDENAGIHMEPKKPMLYNFEISENYKRFRQVKKLLVCTCVPQNLVSGCSCGVVAL
jgi:hypothetical protein